MDERIMKKILLKRNKKQDKKKTPSRITNDTIAVHREQILAGGRKFKYPIQYAKHKLVINTIAISLASILVLVFVCWVVLYPMQNTSMIAYRITNIARLPVGAVDGEDVKYSDYLVQYRASEFYLNKYGEKTLNSSDWSTQINGIKRRSIDLAEQVAYARKLGKKSGTTISDNEINSFIDKERTTVNGRVSQETYDASIKMLYGESADDYRLIVKNGLLKNKVAFAIDDKAQSQANKALESLSAVNTNGDMGVAAKEANKISGAGKVTSGSSGSVDISGKFNGLRISDVANIAVGKMSGIIKSSNDDGYYIVKVSAKTTKKITFDYVHVPLTVFEKQFEQLKKDNKIKEYISVPEVDTGAPQG